MTRLLLGAALAALVALRAFADESASLAETRLSFAGIAPGMTAVEAIAEAPGLEWRPLKVEDNEESAATSSVMGANAGRQTTFADAAWSLQVGWHNEFGDTAGARRLRLNHFSNVKTAAACRTIFDAALAHLETALGAFGLAPGYVDFKSAAIEHYPRASFHRFKTEVSPHGSKVRAYPKRDYVERWDTHRPADAYPFNITLEASLVTVFESKTCDIALTFLPPQNSNPVP